MGGPAFFYIVPLTPPSPHRGEDEGEEISPHRGEGERGGRREDGSLVV